MARGPHKYPNLDTTKHHLHCQIVFLVEVVGQGQADPVDALGGVQLQQRLARLYVPRVLPLLDLQAHSNSKIERIYQIKRCESHLLTNLQEYLLHGWINPTPAAVSTGLLVHSQPCLEDRSSICNTSKKISWGIVRRCGNCC